MQKKATAPENFACVLCGKPKPEEEYFKSYSPLYKHLGHVPICKSCFRQQFQRYIVEYNDTKRALERMCEAFDMYYNDKLFSENDDANIVLNNFIKRLNLSQNNRKTYDDTIAERVVTSAKGNELVDNLFEDDRRIRDKLVDKWGEGLNYVDYNELEKHYNYLKAANPNCDSNQEIFIIDLCYIKMQQLKAVRNGDADTYKKMADAYRQSFQQAGLQATKDASVNDSFTIGVSADIIEHYTPAEYYQDKKLYRDFDGIGEYIERFMLRPLRNLMHGTNDRDKEFYVPDEDEGDDEE